MSESRQLNDIIELYNMNEWHKAECAAIDFTKNFPKHSFGWKALGAILCASGKLTLAIDTFKQAILLHPNDPETYNNLGNCFKGIGRTQEAQECYNQAIHYNPNYPEAHYNLGNLLKDLGQIKEAKACYERAIDLKKDFFETYCNLGNILRDLNQLDDACKSYKQAIIIKPDYADAHYNLGNCLSDLNLFEDAIASYSKALDINPNSAAVHFNMGNALRLLGRFDEAVASYKQTIYINPNHAEAHNNLGITFADLHRFESAEASYRCSIDFKPDYAEAFCNLGITLNELTRFAEAEACYKRAIDLKPFFSIAYSGLANTLREVGRKDEAEAYCRVAIHISPDYAEAHNNLGAILKELGRFEEAQLSYRKAISLNPNYADAFNNLGNLLRDSGRLDEAEFRFRQAININYNHAGAHNNLGNVLKDLGRLEEAHICYKQAITINPKFVEAHSNLLFLMSYSDILPPSNYILEAYKYNQTHSFKKRYEYSNWSEITHQSCLRIGFVSGDFRNHPVGYFIEGLCKCINTERIELIAFSNTRHEDDLSKRIKPFFREWHYIIGKNDELASQAILEARVNILIDLSGHTAHNRLGIFAYKPAPIQVTWLGYWASTGLTQMDYILGDPYVTPPSETSHFSEMIWRLPETYLCFSPVNLENHVSPLPALKNGYITFGCFNNLSKIGRHVVMLWCDLMSKIPNSRLFLKTKQFTDPVAIRAVQSQFTFCGLDPGRLILEGPSPRTELLDSYNRVDVALDPFPYPGGTTSVESLWMGVPVLTIKGDRFLSHIGESIAHNAGQSDWIAHDANSYVTKAQIFTSNLETLSDLRQRLREKVLASPLFNSQRFARHFEEAMWNMWFKFLKDKGKC